MSKPNNDFGCILLLGRTLQSKLGYNVVVCIDEKSQRTSDRSFRVLQPLDWHVLRLSTVRLP